MVSRQRRKSTRRASGIRQLSQHTAAPARTMPARPRPNRAADAPTPGDRLRLGGGLQPNAVRCSLPRGDRRAGGGGAPRPRGSAGAATSFWRGRHGASRPGDGHMPPGRRGRRRCARIVRGSLMSSEVTPGPAWGTQTLAHRTNANRPRSGRGRCSRWRTPRRAARYSRGSPRSHGPAAPCGYQPAAAGAMIGTDGRAAIAVLCVGEESHGDLVARSSRSTSPRGSGRPGSPRPSGWGPGRHDMKGSPWLDPVGPGPSP